MYGKRLRFLYGKAVSSMLRTTMPPYQCHIFCENETGTGNRFRLSASAHVAAVDTPTLDFRKKHVNTRGIECGCEYRKQKLDKDLNTRLTCMTEH